MYRIPYSSLACREVLSIIRDNARSGGGEGAHVLLGGGGLAFLGLESSKEEALTALEKAQNRQGVGRLVLRAAHTAISHILFGNLVICQFVDQREKKISRPFRGLGIYFQTHALCNVVCR